MFRMMLPSADAEKAQQLLILGKLGLRVTTLALAARRFRPQMGRQVKRYLLLELDDPAGQIGSTASILPSNQ